jgi:omega-hydroxy-beta-dihydromenaquinone-9 sulfotransferase
VSRSESQPPLLDRWRMKLADEVFSNLSGLRRREWKRIKAVGGGIDRRYRLRSWFLSLSAFANDLTPRPSHPSPSPEPRHPAFILGHWRSGTTLLHEVLAMDPRFAAPTLVDVLTPTSGPFQQWVIAAALRVFLPRRRPLDGMTWGPNRPAEDDLALAALGLSPYLAWSFPRNAEYFERNLDLDELTPDELAEWRSAMSANAARWSQRYRKPLLLKSPPHTARLSTLATMFPEAKFVLIHRHPCATFTSSLRLARDGTKPMRLQEQSDEEARAGVLRRAEKMFAAYRKGRSELPPGRLVEIAYDDLVADPVATAERIIAAWGMTPDPTMGARWKEFQKNAAPVRPTPRSELSVDDKADVRQAFRFLFEKFGYEA